MSRHSESFRFRPPPIDFVPELQWTLTRAFAPPETASTHVVNPERARRWATALGLAPRIVHRNSAEGLETELGEFAAGALVRQRQEAAARALLLRKLLERVADQAGSLCLPLIAIKGMALLEAGISAWGSRPLVDVDLLLDPERAEDLIAALRKTGIRPLGEAEAHHPPPLADPDLGQVELHRCLPGVNLRQGRPATAEDLLQLGHLRPSPELPGLYLPSTEILTAHAVAHAFDQHGFSPHAYPITRLAADWLDLQAASGRDLEGLLEDAEPLLANTLSRRELDGLAALCTALASGADQCPAGDAGAILCHTIAGMTDSSYRRRLRARAALRALRRGHWSKLRRQRQTARHAERRRLG